MSRLLTDLAMPSTFTLKFAAWAIFGLLVFATPIAAASGIPWQDWVNGSFETCGALFIAMSIVQLHGDKLVRGVSWSHVLFFAGWGFWNPYYYGHLEQWFSLGGGMLIATANTIWLLQILYYLWREHKDLNWVVNLNGSTD